MREAPEIARVPEDWTSVGSLASLPDGSPAVRTVGDVPVLIYRRGDQVSALIERCGHETGPLSEGEVTGSGADARRACRGRGMPSLGDLLLRAGGATRHARAWPSRAARERRGGRSDGDGSAVLARSTAPHSQPSPQPTRSDAGSGIVTPGEARLGGPNSPANRNRRPQAIAGAECANPQTVRR
ncbi:Rieske 2Fe-2S domain-containing protein [Actinoplanes sp. NPDC026623]|uniref:Rieske (2Fe-2S) protein n=1 Tax=Actinoplanes sp. NPDC026623 TaxID=3155610 RepID=UPI0033FC9FF8